MEKIFREKEVESPLVKYEHVEIDGQQEIYQTF